MGASREMTIAALAEPTILMSVFALSARVSSTSLPAIVAAGAADGARLASPASLLAAVALAVVVLAECGRLPVDNPATHLELTMVHEAMVLEYSGPDLALIELGASLRLAVLLGLLVQPVRPLGHRHHRGRRGAAARPGRLRWQERAAGCGAGGQRGVHRQAAAVPGPGAAGRILPTRRAGRGRLLLPGLRRE